MATTSLSRKGFKQHKHQLRRLASISRSSISRSGCRRLRGVELFDVLLFADGAPRRLLDEQVVCIVQNESMSHRMTSSSTARRGQVKDINSPTGRWDTLRFNLESTVMSCDEQCTLGKLSDGG